VSPDLFQLFLFSQDFSLLFVALVDQPLKFEFLCFPLGCLVSTSRLNFFESSRDRVALKLSIEVSVEQSRAKVLEHVDLAGAGAAFQSGRIDGMSFGVENVTSYLRQLFYLAQHEQLEELE